MFYYKSKKKRINKRNFEKLKTTSGVCIFVDIVNSTELKNVEFQQWCIQIYNTLIYISDKSPLFSKNLVKVIGDELMFFIQDEAFGVETYDSVLDFLRESMEAFPVGFHDLKLETKASVHYCSNVYPISFIQNRVDYYGQEIDLTARLLSKTGKNQIIISEEFHSKLIDKSLDNFMHTNKVYEDMFKGISKPIEYRRLIFK